MNHIVDDQPTSDKLFSGQQPKNPKFATTVRLIGPEMRHGVLCRVYRANRGDIWLVFGEGDAR
jgi:hypothetical protein